jgi:hypothetical protein
VLLTDVWKTVDIVEVIQKTNQPVPPQVQVKCFSRMFIVEVMQLQKTNKPVPPQVQVQLPLPRCLEGSGVQTEVINFSVGVSNRKYLLNSGWLIDCRRWWTDSWSASRWTESGGWRRMNSFRRWGSLLLPEIEVRDNFGENLYGRFLPFNKTLKVLSSEMDLVKIRLNR